MAKVTFKTKLVQSYYADGEPVPMRITLPAFKRIHCDMSAFRTNHRLSMYANSDMFLSMIHRECAKVVGGNSFRLDSIPEGVTVDASGFLAVVTIEVI